MSDQNPSEGYYIYEEECIKRGKRTKRVEERLEEDERKEEIFRDLFSTNGSSGGTPWDLLEKDTRVSLSDKSYRAWAPFEIENPAWVRARRGVKKNEIARWTLEVGKKDGGKPYRFGVTSGGQKAQRWTFDSEKTAEEDQYFEFELDRTNTMSVLKFWQKGQPEKVCSNLPNNILLYPCACLLCKDHSYTILSFEEGIIGGSIKGE